VTRLFIVRHGQTAWNAAGRLQGSSEVPLSDLGREQIAATAQRLARILEPQPIIVSSPLSRAVDTAQAIARAVGADVAVEPRLIERAYGVWEGLTEAERDARYPEENQRWRERYEPLIDGYEGHSAVASRMKAALDAWLPRASADLVLVTHGSSARMLVETLLGLPTGGHRIGNLNNAAWSLLVPAIDGPWSLLQHNAGADA
jgi:broad specificity phosphatase PhoE